MDTTGSTRTHTVGQSCSPNRMTRPVPIGFVGRDDCTGGRTAPRGLWVAHHLGVTDRVRRRLETVVDECDEVRVATETFSAYVESLRVVHRESPEAWVL